MNIAGSCCGTLWLAVVVQHQHQLQFQHHGLVMAVAGSGCESFLLWLAVVVKVCGWCWVLADH